MTHPFTVTDLVKTFGSGAKRKVALDSVSLELPDVPTIGIVGESGSGKSTLARCLVGLVKPDSGRIAYKGRDLSQFDSAERRGFRREVQMVFQDPYSSLNPRMRVRDIVSEGVRVLGVETEKEAIDQRIKRILNDVGISDEQFDRYPRQFSGGQRQRVSIARALAVSPRVLICDEPVSSLDVSIQAQILNLLREESRLLDLKMIFISHDLGVIRYVSDYIVVMQGGRVVEAGAPAQIFDAPQAEYTKSLIDAVPILDPGVQRQRFSLQK